ncbi:MAG TPA: hypothetical protein DF712_12740 [Balneola sp.]|nr:hypothetical protein [Bacteroidota bacterium]MAB66522.1 hypothetical protein [Bacteroidota bacterium]HCI72396.1 hypothetical protein [Balneola sp.]HCT53312.1 hypothetical protein [Balneola sp.]|tara:strand:- start:718 stop:1233 length:516 start_codon:yes stop_codon:yes gene_type:complete
MKRNLLGFKIFLEWIIPDEWNSHIQKSQRFEWSGALKSIGLLFLLILVILLLEERFIQNVFLIILSSIGLALFFYFLEYFLTRFTRSVSSPEATIYKSVIRVKYWDSRDDVFIKDIIGYKFNRVIINSIEISVLVLQLKKDRVFEIGLPNIEFEENIKSVLTQTFNIPYFD